MRRFAAGCSTEGHARYKQACRRQAHLLRRRGSEPKYWFDVSCRLGRCRRAIACCKVCRGLLFGSGQVGTGQSPVAYCLHLSICCRPCSGCCSCGAATSFASFHRICSGHTCNIQISLVNSRLVACAVTCLSHKGRQRMTQCVW